MDLGTELEAIKQDGVAALSAAEDHDALEAVRVALLGRSGRLKAAKQAFGAASPDDKRTYGRVLAEVDQALKAALEARQQELSRVDTERPPIDVTLPAPERTIGSIHPISQIAADVERVFHGMGYEVVDGPHIEEEDFNFTLLNIPADHPARDAQDTFWLNHGKLLRTHTSAVQSRTYPAADIPIRKVVVGKVFRYEEVDATHDNTFTQVEGFLVDEGVTIGHLIGTLETMIRGVLRRDDVEIRLRPSFFPFVEPGFEVDVRSTADGAGRFADWVELLGCGMIHPDVLRAGGIDPDRYQGFAFGLGLERLAMIRHDIGDIRVFNGGDLRALHQFAS